MNAENREQVSGEGTYGKYGSSLCFEMQSPHVFSYI